MLRIILYIGLLGFCQCVQRPLVIAHRGTAYLPEHTFASQSMAHAYGADMIELDVCLSRDNQLVVIHDITLDAVTNVHEVFPNRTHSDGLHYVIDFDLEELRRLKMHERTNSWTGVQTYPSRFPANSKVPFHLSILNETLDLLAGLNHATGRQLELLIEIKKPEYHYSYNRSISSIVIDTLKAFNLTRPTDPVILQTFYIEDLMYIRKVLNSELRLFALMTWNHVNESSSDYDYYRSEAGLRNLSTVVQALAPDHELVVDYDSNRTIIGNTNLTKWAHQYNLKVYPYTFRQDRSSSMGFQELVKYFWQNVTVDGFITDHPDVVLDILQTNEPLKNSTALASHVSSSLLIVTFSMIGISRI